MSTGLLLIAGSAKNKRHEAKSLAPSVMIWQHARGCGFTFTMDITLNSNWVDSEGCL